LLVTERTAALLEPALQTVVALGPRGAAPLLLSLLRVLTACAGEATRVNFARSDVCGALLRILRTAGPPELQMLAARAVAALAPSGAPPVPAPTSSRLTGGEQRHAVQTFGAQGSARS
jgi:hypothetical protein